MIYSIRLRSARQHCHSQLRPEPLGILRQELEAFLNTPRVEVLRHDLETADYYALIVKRLKGEIRPNLPNDIWIAANAIKHGLALYSFDRHFEAIEGLLLFPEIKKKAVQPGGFCRWSERSIPLPPG